MTTATATPAVDAKLRAYLDISTAHVTEPVMQNIASVPGVLADTTPYGAWVWVPSDIDERIDYTAGQIPQCIIDIWRHAQALGCDHVHHDCDAEIDEALPHLRLVSTLRAGRQASACRTRPSCS